jgi:hypothetical protein
MKKGFIITIAAIDEVLLGFLLKEDVKNEWGHDHFRGVYTIFKKKAEALMKIERAFNAANQQPVSIQKIYYK